MNPDLKAILIRIIIPVFAPLAVILAGIWGTASWTVTQDNRISALNDRVTELETTIKNDRMQDSRISALELRLNWLDEEKKRERIESQQLNREIRDSLEKLNQAVTRLEANDPYKRRR